MLHIMLLNSALLTLSLADQKENHPPNVPIVIILDCCRTELNSYRVVSGHIDTKAKNVALLFSTSTGEGASDGTDMYGAYTEFLLQHIDTTDNLGAMTTAIRKSFSQDKCYTNQVCTSVHRYITDFSY